MKSFKSLSLLSQSLSHSHLRTISSSSPRFLSSTSSSSSSSSQVHPLISHLDPSTLPPTLRSSIHSSTKSLYQHLSSLPSDGVGTKVRQKRWRTKGLNIPASQPITGPISVTPSESESVAEKQTSYSYWKVTRVSLKEDGKHGKAWGKLIWRGELQWTGMWRQGRYRAVFLRLEGYLQS